jgi:uncharacterized protein (TIGR00369 family)
MDELLQMGRTALAAQPFSQLLGAELIVFRPGEAELALTIRPDLLQQHGFVHGGVIGYLTDNALTFAGGSVLGPAVVTSEYKINYLKPAREGRLVARATVVTPGSRQAVCRCDVWIGIEEGESLCATAQGTIALLSEPRSRK